MIAEEKNTYKKDTSAFGLHGKVHVVQVFFYNNYSLDSTSPYENKEYCIFDTAGNLTDYSMYHGTALKLRQLMTFNKEHLYTKVVLEDGAGKQAAQTTYQFDESGHILEEILQQADSPLVKETYTYDTWGNVNMVKGDVKMHIYKKFDDDSIVTEENWFCISNLCKDTNYMGNTVFKRDLNGRLTELSSYNPNKELTNQLLKEYNDKGQLVKMTSLENNKKVVKSYSYEAHGLVSEEWGTDPDTGLAALLTKSEYTFDDHGNWTWSIKYDRNNQIMGSSVRYITYY